MQPEVVGAREAAVAVAAAKRLGTSVLTNVAGQLVGPSKAPFAFDPAALVRFFTWNSIKTEFQISSLHHIQIVPVSHVNRGYFRDINLAWIVVPKPILN